MQKRIVTTRAMTMQMSNGRQVRTVDMREAAEIIGCRIEDISYWLAQEWIENIECGCCGAVFAALDEITDIANLVVLDDATDFDTLVFQRFEEVQEQVRPRSQKLLPERVEQSTLRTHRLPEMSGRSTRRLNDVQAVEQDPLRDRRGRELETRGCRVVTTVPEADSYEKKRRRWQPGR